MSTSNPGFAAIASRLHRVSRRGSPVFWVVFFLFIGGIVAVSEAWLVWDAQRVIKAGQAGQLLAKPADCDRDRLGPSYHSVTDKTYVWWLHRRGLARYEPQTRSWLCAPFVNQAALVAALDADPIVHVQSGPSGLLAITSTHRPIALAIINHETTWSWSTEDHLMRLADVTTELAQPTEVAIADDGQWVALRAGSSIWHYSNRERTWRGPWELGNEFDELRLHGISAKSNGRIWFSHSAGIASITSQANTSEQLPTVPVQDGQLVQLHPMQDGAVALVRHGCDAVEGKGSVASATSAYWIAGTGADDATMVLDGCAAAGPTPHDLLDIISVSSSRGSQVHALTAGTRWAYNPVMGTWQTTPETKLAADSLAGAWFFGGHTGILRLDRDPAQTAATLAYLRDGNEQWTTPATFGQAGGIYMANERASWTMPSSSRSGPATLWANTSGLPVVIARGNAPRPPPTAEVAATQRIICAVKRNASVWCVDTLTGQARDLRGPWGRRRPRLLAHHGLPHILASARDGGVAEISPPQPNDLSGAWSVRAWPQGLPRGAEAVATSRSDQLLAMDRDGALLSLQRGGAEGPSGRQRVLLAAQPRRTEPLSIRRYAATTECLWILGGNAPNAAKQARLFAYCESDHAMRRVTVPQASGRLVYLDAKLDARPDARPDARLDARDESLVIVTDNGEIWTMGVSTRTWRRLTDASAHGPVTAVARTPDGLWVAGKALIFVDWNGRIHPRSMSIPRPRRFFTTPDGLVWLAADRTLWLGDQIVLSEVRDLACTDETGCLIAQNGSLAAMTIDPKTRQVEIDTSGVEAFSQLSDIATDIAAVDVAIDASGTAAMQVTIVNPDGTRQYCLASKCSDKPVLRPGVYASFQVGPWSWRRSYDGAALAARDHTLLLHGQEVTPKSGGFDHDRLTTDRSRPQVGLWSDGLWLRTQRDGVVVYHGWNGPDDSLSFDRLRRIRDGQAVIVLPSAQGDDLFVKTAAGWRPVRLDAGNVVLSPALAPGTETSRKLAAIQQGRLLVPYNGKYSVWRGSDGMPVLDFARRTASAAAAEFAASAAAMSLAEAVDVFTALRPVGADERGIVLAAADGHYVLPGRNWCGWSCLQAVDQEVITGQHRRIVIAGWRGIAKQRSVRCQTEIMRYRRRYQQRCRIVRGQGAGEIAIPMQEPLFSWDGVRDLRQRQGEDGRRAWGIQTGGEIVLTQTQGGLRADSNSDWQPIRARTTDAHGWHWHSDNGVELTMTVAGRELSSKLIAVHAPSAPAGTEAAAQAQGHRLGYMLQRDRVLDLSAAKVPSPACGGFATETQCTYALVELNDEHGPIQAVMRGPGTLRRQFGQLLPVNPGTSALLATTAGVWILDDERLSLWEHSLTGRYFSVPQPGIHAGPTRAITLRETVDAKRILILQRSAGALRQLAVVGPRQWRPSNGQAWGAEAANRSDLPAAMDGTLTCYAVHKRDSVSNRDCAAFGSESMTIARAVIAEGSRRWRGWTYHLSADGAVCVAHESRCSGEIAASEAGTASLAIQRQVGDDATTWLFPQAQAGLPGSRMLPAGPWIVELATAQQAWQDGRDPLLALHRARDAFGDPACGDALAVAWDEGRWHALSQQQCAVISGDSASDNLPAPVRDPPHVHLAGWLSGRQRQAAGLQFRHDTMGVQLFYPSLTAAITPDRDLDRIGDVLPTSAGIVLQTEHKLLYELHETEAALLAYPPRLSPSP